MMDQNVINEIVDAIQGHLADATIINFGSTTFRELVGHITCKDGCRLSVQAGKTCYSEPRNNTGPWTAVEVMVISDHTPKFWTVDAGDVAGWVPIEDVAKEIYTRGHLVLTD